ncbi:MAG: beta-lactamase family protein [Alphaproteobacteria bacterium]|nr:beta-lactamase family protein [Alphaproteobacteria bacterium]
MSIVFAFLLWVVTAAPLGSAVLSDADITRILAERVESKQAVGLVVGVIEPQGRRVVVHGRLDRKSDRPPDRDTLFEIGSVTKVFTALLLAEMAGRGEVGLDDPVAKLLPAGTKVPERGRPITLTDLSNHRSGLPRLPTNLKPLYWANPYADYTVDALYAFLADYRMRRDPGTAYEYSNLGVGLLGHALALRAGRDYESLLRERIIVPLGLRDTSIALSPAQSTRLAPGHNRSRTPTPNWDIPTFAGAGALKSSASDLLTFLSASLGLTESPLAPVIAQTLAALWPRGGGGYQALGWHISGSGAAQITWHAGGTGGYRAFIGMLRQQRTGVVVLSNAAYGIEDIGFHLLDPRRPLAMSTAADQEAPAPNR